VDVKRGRRRLIKEKFPFLKITENYSCILDNIEVNAVAIVTDVENHGRIAKKFMEKPFYLW